MTMFPLDATNLRELGPLPRFLRQCQTSAGAAEVPFTNCVRPGSQVITGLCTTKGGALCMLGLRHYQGIAIDLYQGDITAFACDGIVNAANVQLAGGGGVDGAIHRVGGPEVMRECRSIGSCAPGDAVATTAGKLPARYVLHAVGPVWQGGGQGEAKLLAGAYRRCLTLGETLGLRHLAFPAISTGAYGFPVGKAAEIALTAVKIFAEALPKQPSDESRATLLRRATFVLFSHEHYAAFQDALFRLFPEDDD